jgi:8-oxo-dGTP pyrophosphatase MutT (NUDIX family)
MPEFDAHHLAPRPPHLWPAVPETVTSTCDNASVGVLIFDQDGRLLMFRRQTAPAGIAPPAGHVDEHGSVVDAAVAEVREEVGLLVTALQPVVSARWLPNVCRRQHGPCGPGHNWTVYAADTVGELALGEREAADARWYTPAEVAALARRTVDYGRGRLPEQEWAAAPGLEPAWCWLLHDAGLLRLSPPDRAVVVDLFIRSPHAGPPVLR